MDPTLPLIRCLFVALTVLAILASSGHEAVAAPGDPVLSFGSRGVARHDFPGDRESFDAVAVQSDGKLVVCGGVDYISDEQKFAVVRYLGDGTVDATFGVDGLAAIDFPGGNEFAYDILVQPDGKIVAAGQAAGPGVLDFAIARFDASGALDPTFGAGGTVVFDVGGGMNMIRSVALQADGKILAGGGATLARFATDGTLDATFGVGGIVTVSSGIEGIVVQPDGMILAGGFLARFDAAGAPDPTFGTAGIAPIGGTDLALQDDGKLVVSIVTRDYHSFLVRYLADGSPDPSFGTGGSVELTLGEDTQIAAVATTPFGIVSVGRVGGDEKIFFMTRHRADGTLDSTFGARGIVRAFPDINEFLDFEVALAPDGTLLSPFSVASRSPRSELVVARFVGGGVLRCSPAPLAGCAEPVSAGKSGLTIKSPAPPLAPTSKLAWKWQRGSAVAFGDPVATDDYVFCVYADTDGTPTLVTEASAPAGGVCGAKPCWKPTGTGVKYADRDRTPEGVASLSLGVTPSGAGKIVLQARGTNLQSATVPLALPVRAQLQGEQGACWETRLTAASVQRNEGGKFSGRDAP